LISPIVAIAATGLRKFARVVKISLSPSISMKRVRILSSLIPLMH
jgi:hypothetical protein